MKVKSVVKTAGSACATVASVVVGVQGVKAISNAKDTKGKIIAGVEIIAGAAGTIYSGMQLASATKELAGSMKKSLNSPETVAQSIN